MINLLRANLLRLIKNKPFYAALAAQAAIMLFVTINAFLTKKLYPVTADGYFTLTVCSVFAAAMLAVVCCLFIGADYSNGTIRNKLIVGISKTKLYFANLITVMVIALGLNIASMIVFYPLTLPLLGGFVGKADDLVKMFFIGNVVMLAYAALYNAIAMVSKSTVIALIVSVASLAIMTLVSMSLLSEINAPPTYTEVIMNEFGEMVSVTKPNPSRKSEAVLQAFKILLNLYPSGQVAVFGGSSFIPWLTSIGALGVIGLSGGVGLAAFAKENIK